MRNTQRSISDNAKVREFRHFYLEIKLYEAVGTSYGLPSTSTHSIRITTTTTTTTTTTKQYYYNTSVFVSCTMF
jgi:hypothetical protein